MKKFNKTCLMILALGATLCLAGCGNKDNSEATTEANTTEATTTEAEATEETSEDVATEDGEETIDTSAYAYVPTYTENSKAYELTWNYAGEETGSSQTVIYTPGAGDVGNDSYVTNYISLPNLGVGMPVYENLSFFEGDHYSDGSNMGSSYEDGITYSPATSEKELLLFENQTGLLSVMTNTVEDISFEDAQKISEESWVKAFVVDNETYAGKTTCALDEDGNYRVTMQINKTFGGAEFVGYELIIITPELLVYDVSMVEFASFDWALSESKLIVDHVDVLKKN